MRWIYWADWSPSWVFGDSSENPDEEPKCKESSTLNAQKRIGNRRPITLPEEVQEQGRQLGVPRVFGGETSYIVRGRSLELPTIHNVNIQYNQNSQEGRPERGIIQLFSSHFKVFTFTRLTILNSPHASCNEKNILLIYVQQMIEWQTRGLCWLDVCVIELILNMLISMFFGELDVWFFISHFSEKNLISF